MCEFLEALQSIYKIFFDNEDGTKINLHITSDCLGVIIKLEKDFKVVSMSTKLHPIIRKFLSLNLKRLWSLMFTKVDEHQDDIKSLEQSSFLEKINTEFDARAKKLITESAEDEVTPFPLELNSVCVMNSDNHLILNCASDLTIHVHLIGCEVYLKTS